ncbi:MAG: hypothetical protein R2746_08935 [Acidimicrobiales bacterium]
MAVGALPLLVAVVALSRTTWYPWSRPRPEPRCARRASGATRPSWAPPGRIATAPTCDPGPLCFGQQGQPPGPAMFWASWPLWWVLGGSGWAYQASVAALAVAAAATVYVAYRHRGPRLSRSRVAVVGAVLARSGPARSQPWNPYTPLVPYLLFVVLCWAAVSGRAKALPAAVAAGPTVQCHVGYAPAWAPGWRWPWPARCFGERRTAVQGPSGAPSPGRKRGGAGGRGPVDPADHRPKNSSTTGQRLDPARHLPRPDRRGDRLPPGRPSG